MGLTKYTVQGGINTSLGQNGSAYLLNSDVQTITGNFVAITMLADCQFDDFTDSSRDETDGDAVTSSTIFPKGITIFGQRTSISVDSGSCICYKG